MFKRTKISTGTLLALSLIAASAAIAQGAPQRVEITGSNIKRIGNEGPLPVEVITRADIERKGVTSTNDLLRSLTYMSSYNDELISNSPNTTGSASAGFRGLSGDQTVVLLNGRRLANYGFDGAFVNLNTIPLGAIQRVEVLKDGAAAIYGADAIGGVINFITRKDYKGIEMTGSYGLSGQGDTMEASAGITAGFGQLETDRFNLLVNLNYMKRDPLNNLERDRTSTADYPKLLTTPSPLTPGAAGSSSCLFDFAPYRTTLYSTERLGGLAAGRIKVSENLQVFGEFMFANSDSFASSAPTPGNFSLPVGHPANTFARLQRGRRPGQEQGHQRGRRLLLARQDECRDRCQDFQPVQPDQPAVGDGRDQVQ